MNKAQRAIAKLLNIPIDEKALPPGLISDRYDIINGQIISSSDNRQNYLNQGYLINDLIYSIVNLITEKVRVAPWLAYKVVDDAALKRYEGIMGKKNLTAEDRNLALKWRNKALVPLDADGKLNELLQYPNDSQTFPDLVADSAIYKLLDGNRYIYAEMLKEGANKGKPQHLHILPSQDVSILVNRAEWPLSILGYQLMTWGIRGIDRAAVMHDKYFNPAADVNGSHLYGLAPMKSALRLTDRSNNENKAATSVYANGGLKAIVYVDDPRMMPAEAEAQVNAIKQKLTGQEYRGGENSNKLAVSGYKMGIVPVGLSPVDLDIIESEKWSLRRFCNVFGGVPSQLLNDPDNKVYNNTVEGEKALTTRCAIPLLNSFRGQFNRKLGSDWGYQGKNIYIDYDITVYTELQEDLGKKWGWVKELPVPNGYKLDMMGLDHPEGQEQFMNEILVPSGYTLSSDYAANETDADLEAGDEEISTDPEGGDV
jgi:HK97 family phage portal protein